MEIRYPRRKNRGGFLRRSSFCYSSVSAVNGTTLTPSGLWPLCGFLYHNHKNVIYSRNINGLDKFCEMLYFHVLRGGMIMEQMGKLIGIYKPRKARFIGLAAAGSVIAAVGLFVLWAAYAVSGGGITYRGGGDPVLLLVIIGAVLVAGGALFVCISVKGRGKIIFELYENGIVIKPKKAEPACLMFAEIEDILPLTVVGGDIYNVVYITHLAFRKNPSSEWFAITPLISGYKELNEQFVTLHTKERGALVFDQWQKTGLPVQIRYVDKSAMRNPYFTKNMASYLKPFSSFKTLLLAKNYIKIDNQTINFDSDCKLEIGGWTDNIYLKDSNGKEKFRIHYSTVLSADIFTALLSAQMK
jgi:hypothetical protein